MTYLPGMAPEIISDASGDDWYTPPWLLAWIGHIALDPCWSAASAVQAAVTIDLRRGEDGLTTPWEPMLGDGVIFVNPPFSDTAAWLKRCRQESARLRSVVVVLVPAMAGETAWASQVWGHAAWVGFFRGRLSFFSPDGRSEPKGRGHALIIYGPRQAANEVRDRIAGEARRHPQRPWWVPGNWNLTGE